MVFYNYYLELNYRSRRNKLFRHVLGPHLPYEYIITSNFFKHNYFTTFFVTNLVFALSAAQFWLAHLKYVRQAA